MSVIRPKLYKKQPDLWVPFQVPLCVCVCVRARVCVSVCVDVRTQALTLCSLLQRVLCTSHPNYLMYAHPESE